MKTQNLFPKGTKKDFVNHQKPKHEEGFEIQLDDVTMEESGNNLMSELNSVDLQHQFEAEDKENEPPTVKVANFEAANVVKSQNPLKCSICNKVLANIFLVRKHIERVHEKLKRFNCNHCPKDFYSKSDLVRHVKHRHIFTNDDTSNANLPFKCEVKGCGKHFKMKTALSNHQKISHAKEN